MVVLRRSSNDANVTFQVADVRSLQQRPQHATDIKKREISIRSQSQSCLNSKYLWFVSLRGASLHPGGDVTAAFVSICFYPTSVSASVPASAPSYFY